MLQNPSLITRWEKWLPALPSGHELSQVKLPHKYQVSLILKSTVVLHSCVWAWTYEGPFVNLISRNNLWKGRIWLNLTDLGTAPFKDWLLRLAFFNNYFYTWSPIWTSVLLLLHGGKFIVISMYPSYLRLNSKHYQSCKNIWYIMPIYRFWKTLKCNLYTVESRLFAWMNGFTTVAQFQWSSGKTKTSYDPTRLITRMIILDLFSLHESLIYSINIHINENLPGPLPKFPKYYHG